MTRPIGAALAFSAGLVSAAFLSTPPRLEPFELEQPHMGTLFRLVLYAASEAEAAAAGRNAFARIAELDALLSDYRAESELSRLSQTAGLGPAAVSADLYDVLSAAQAFAARTDGAFDVTAGAITHLWRRARRQGERPAAPELSEALALSGYRLMHLDAAARTVRFERAGMRLDAGGIGKGYAADRALERLREAGVPRALVVAGGDVRAGDPPPGAAGWDVAVAGMEGGGQVMTLVRAAVSTSGDLEQWLEVDGVRYSHIVDPRTGQALTVRRQVSALASDATTSDMLATAASVMEEHEALRLAEAIDGAAILIETADDTGVRRVRSTRWPE